MILEDFLLLLSGGAPAITVTGDGDFGNTPIGTPVSRVFTITNEDEEGNPGSSTLEITLPITSSDPAFTITVQQPPVTSLAPGASTTFTAQYSGASPIAYSGNLSIVSNAASSPTIIAVTATSAYATRVLATSPAPLRYNQLHEGSGLTIVDSSVNAFTGTAVGITWDAGQSPTTLPAASVPFSDGTNDYINLYSTAFGSAFNLDEGSVLIWLKVANAGVWTDGTNRRIFELSRDAATNRIYAFKSSTNNTITVERRGNAVTDTINITISNTGWFCLEVSWSVANNALIARVNKVQQGTTQTGLLNATGTGLLSTQTVLGALSTVPTQVWHGYKSDAIMFTSFENAAIIALGGI